MLVASNGGRCGGGAAADRIQVGMLLLLQLQLFALSQNRWHRCRRHRRRRRSRRLRHCVGRRQRPIHRRRNVYNGRHLADHVRDDGDLAGAASTDAAAAAAGQRVMVQFGAPAAAEAVRHVERLLLLVRLLLHLMGLLLMQRLLLLLVRLRLIRLQLASAEAAAAAVAARVLDAAAAMDVMLLGQRNGRDAQRQRSIAAIIVRRFVVVRTTRQ